MDVVTRKVQVGLMGRIKEVTVFSLGDSSELSTWSNVPYFFTQTLQSKGIRINRVDLSPRIWSKVLNRALLLCFRIFRVDTTFDFTRSAIHYWTIKRRIGRAVGAYPNAEFNIFLTFSFSSAGISDIPTVLFADWTYDHCVRHFRGREPDRFERGSIEREDREIEAAERVFVLFPSVAEYMGSRYRNRSIFYLGNVVNALIEVTADDVIRRKAASTDLLFIGGRKYLEGAKRLIDAYAELKPDFPGLTVTIIGMTQQDIRNAPSGVRFYGYLDKGHTPDRETYYDLLLGARVIVNTTPKWGAFSAMIEAMQFYTPVVVTPYDEFVRTFGSSIGFGAYCHDDRPETLVRALRETLMSADYAVRCQLANDAVKGFSWTAYIDRMLAILEQPAPRLQHLPDEVEVQQASG